MNEIIKKNGISYGIITGVVSALITTAIYSIDLNLFVKWWLGIIIFIVYITIGIILLSKTKKELKGIFSFKEAFTTYFISAVIGILISVGFNILLFNVIDPSAKDAINEIVIKYTAETMQKFGAPSSAINEAVKKMQENNPYSTIELIKGSAFSIAGSALFGLLLALIFKSKPTQE
jgi:c-di-AMP phosphodiesterase-like protein